MFTGIVEEAGIVERIQPGTKSIKFFVKSRHCARGLKRGGSLAVNGCCLTAVEVRGRRQVGTVGFDLLEETWRRTNLQFAKPGDRVNLERPLRAGAELGGHFVSGHIDGVGRIKRWEPVGSDRLLEIEAPLGIMKYIVFKGSIAVDGISLTVAKVTKKWFRVWIIPHTFEATALKEREVGDAVNLEGDLLGKYVERFLTWKNS